MKYLKYSLKDQLAQDRSLKYAYNSFVKPNALKVFNKTQPIYDLGNFFRNSLEKELDLLIVMSALNLNFTFCAPASYELILNFRNLFIAKILYFHNES